MGGFCLPAPLTSSFVPTPKLEPNDFERRVVKDFLLLVNQNGLKHSANNYAHLLQKCANGKTLLHGKCLHSLAVKTALESNIYYYNNLLNMYAKCGSMENARQVFDTMPKRNTASWTAMIAGYAQNGYFDDSLQLFCQMQRDGMRFNQFTFGSTLRACAGLEALEFARQVQVQIILKGLESDYFMGCALIDMYCKCGSLNDACRVFDEMTQRDVVSWNAMIAGYTRNGHGEEALELYRQMRRKGTEPVMTTFTSVLSACASLAILEKGKEIHGHILKLGFQVDVSIANALITMYSRCGSINNAFNIFNRMSERDLISWNAMIVGCAQHGLGREGLRLFEQMQEVGTKPDHITYVGVLSACSHVGLAQEGWDYFHSLSKIHNITPTMEHYSCMVDLLGRAGLLEEAHNFIRKMPFRPGPVVWKAFLNACRIRGNRKLGQLAGEELVKVEPQNDATYVLLINIYATACRWDDVERVSRMMKHRGVKKDGVHSWIKVGKKVHVFGVADRSHPQTEDIYAKLGELIEQIKEAGYVPDTNFELHKIEQEQKVHSILHHSEKLAIAFGLISTHPCTPVRIFRNRRVCGDCHTAIKFISKIAVREIIVRDANRFHHFKNGYCSCGDYW